MGRLYGDTPGGDTLVTVGNVEFFEHDARERLSTPGTQIEEVMDDRLQILLHLDEVERPTHAT
jgi:hypothetical protein